MTTTLEPAAWAHEREGADDPMPDSSEPRG